jgi:hypothetical protein
MKLLNKQYLIAKRLVILTMLTFSSIGCVQKGPSQGLPISGLSMDEIQSVEPEYQHIATNSAITGATSISGPQMREQSLAGEPSEKKISNRNNGSFFLK